MGKRMLRWPVRAVNLGGEVTPGPLPAKFDFRL